MQRLPQVHSKINSNFSVILVSGDDQVRWPEKLEHWWFWHGFDSVCLFCWPWAWSEQIFKTICCFIIVPIILCQHSLTWAVSNQPHFLIILYTLLASSYSDCLIACLTLILTTIFGLLFNLVSLDWWVPALNNALHWKLYSAILIIPGDGSWSSVPMIVLFSLLIPTLNRFVSIFSLSPASPGLASPHRSSVTVYTCAELSRVSCHHKWHCITPPTLWADSQLRNGHWAALSSQSERINIPASNNYNGSQDYKLLRH